MPTGRIHAVAVRLLACLAAVLVTCAARTAAADEAAAATARAKGVQAAADGIDEAAERFFLEYRAATGGQQPAFSDATQLLVKTCLRRGRFAEAEAALDAHDAQAAASPPSARDAEALRYWRGALRLAQRRWADAEALLAPLADQAQTPEWRARALEALGDARTRQGKWSAAQQAYGRLVTELPRDPSAGRARFGLFAARLAGGQRAEAAAQLQELEARPPETLAPGTLAFYRILLLATDGQLAEALALFAKEAPGVPARPGVEFRLAAVRLAETLLAAGKPTDALPVLRRALDWSEAGEPRLETRVKILDALLAQGQADAVIAELEAFTKEFPATPERVSVELRLADQLRKAKSHLTAVEYYGRVAENEAAPAAERYQAAYARAACLREAGQFANAGLAFSRASKLGRTPDEQAECLFLAAENTAATGNFTGAALLYQSVADTFPQSVFGEKARFNQGIARAREGQAASAAMILKLFLEQYPRSPLASEARVERGVALRNAGDFLQALAELRAFADAEPAHPLAARALLEAQHAALGGGNADEAVVLLGRLIKDYPDSPLLPTALYQRAHLAFLRGDFKSAQADSDLFLEKYGQSPLAADVLLWLGDHQINTGSPKAGEDYYLLLATRFPASPLAPVALLEAAESAFLRDDQERAAALMGQIQRDYAAALPPPQLAAVEFLQGDMVAARGAYAEALTHFDRAAQLIPNTPLGLAAAGRAGDMHYSLGDGDPAQLDQARIRFAEVVASDKASATEREKARYRLAKTLEKMNRTDEALKEYLEIVYQYPVELTAGRVRDWFYFARAGYDAARLLLIQERYLEAARVYERLARTGIPTAAEASAKAREVREAHNLQD